MKNKNIDLTEKIIKDFVNDLRPKEVEIRKEMDMGYSWDGTNIVCYEIRPQWNNPEVILHHEFAKIRFYKTKKSWRLYWMRASGKWESYGPHPESTFLEELLDVIKKDAFHCFFG